MMITLSAGDCLSQKSVATSPFQTAKKSPLPCTGDSRGHSPPQALPVHSRRQSNSPTSGPRFSINDCRQTAF